MRSCVRCAVHPEPFCRTTRLHGSPTARFATVQLCVLHTYPELKAWWPFIECVEATKEKLLKDKDGTLATLQRLRLELPDATQSSPSIHSSYRIDSDAYDLLTPSDLTVSLVLTAAKALKGCASAHGVDYAKMDR